MAKHRRKYVIEIEGPPDHWFETRNGRSNKKIVKTRRRARALMRALGPGSVMICHRRYRATAHLGVTVIREEVYVGT